MNEWVNATAERDGRKAKQKKKGAREERTWSGYSLLFSVTRIRIGLLSGRFSVLRGGDWQTDWASKDEQKAVMWWRWEDKKEATEVQCVSKNFQIGYFEF